MFPGAGDVLVTACEEANDFLWADAKDGYCFLPRAKSLCDLDLVSGAFEGGGKESDQCFIGFRVDWGCRDSNAQLVAEHALDGVLGGPGLDAEREQGRVWPWV